MPFNSRRESRNTQNTKRTFPKLQMPELWSDSRWREVSMTIYQNHELIPPSPKLALVSYIRDYKIVKVKNKFKIKIAKFYEDSWHSAMEFTNLNKDAVKYLKDSGTKESIIRVTNGMINNNPYMGTYKALGLVISDRLENKRNIERLIT